MFRNVGSLCALGLALAMIGSLLSCRAPLLQASDSPILDKSNKIAQAPQKNEEIPIQRISPKERKKSQKLLQKGQAYFHKGAYQKAHKVLGKALALDPFLPEAHLVLGKVGLILGHAKRDNFYLEEARRMFESALLIPPQISDEDDHEALSPMLSSNIPSKTFSTSTSKSSSKSSKRAQNFMDAPWADKPIAAQDLLQLVGDTRVLR